MKITTGTRIPRRKPIRPALPDQRGYAIQYRQGEVNHCPGCSRSNWFVGRRSAECAVCGTALPLSSMAMVFPDLRVAV